MISADKIVHLNHLVREDGKFGQIFEYPPKNSLSLQALLLSDCGVNKGKLEMVIPF